SSSCVVIAFAYFVQLFRLLSLLFFFFFFFSSRRRHTRLVSDWSSDVCSSDLRARLARRALELVDHLALGHGDAAERDGEADLLRSEERRVGKEGRSRGAAYH